MKRAAQIHIRAYLSKRKLSDVPSNNEERNNEEPADGQNEVDPAPAELVNKSFG